MAAKTGCTVCKMGQNGQEIPSDDPKFPGNADLLIIMLGTNDLLKGRSPEQAAEWLERFLYAAPLSEARLC